MITCQKDAFSIPSDITYLNGAYMSAIPKLVEKAGIAAVSQKTQPWSIQANDFFEPTEQVKKLFAQLIGTDQASRIAILPSVSYGIANVVKNITAHAGQNIVLLEEQFPSNIYSWYRFAEKNNCQIKTIKAPEVLKNRGSVWNNKILEAIDENTVAVALPHCHWADGTLFDLKAIRQKTRQVGARLIIDGTQSVGALPFRVNEIQPDALICAAYKWLMGAYSFGFGYYGPSFDNGIPIEENWINRKDSQDFQHLVNYQPMYKPDAHRYSMGENSQFIATPMSIKALELILNWQPENIQLYCKKIAEKTLLQLSNKGIWLEKETNRSHHLFGLRLPASMDMEKIKRKAKANNIYISYRGSAIRIAPYLYNDEADFEKLATLFED